jgi:hypothetical protein
MRKATHKDVDVGMSAQGWPFESFSPLLERERR